MMVEPTRNPQIGLLPGLFYQQKDMPYLNESQIICLDLSLSNNLNIKQLSESICALIALNQSENPLGLFQHPHYETETFLHFINQPLQNTSRLVDLVEYMYESCNNPKHIIADIHSGDKKIESLDLLLQRFYLPFSKGGLIDDDRADPLWIWRYTSEQGNDMSWLIEFSKISNYFLLNRTHLNPTDTVLSKLSSAGIQWKYTE